jgi:hypothetical protein
MGKTLIYVAVLAILGFGVYYLLFRESEGGMYQEKDAYFTVRDTAAIGKIFMVDNEGNSVLLERKANDWTVNKRYAAMPVQVINVLTCLYKQTALTPVAERDYNTVIRLLSTQATKVEVYNREGKQLSVFYVGGQGPDFHGSYMLREGAKQPYLVEVPGFAGYLSPRFSTDINDWRSRLVFALPADSIRSIIVDYYDEPMSSYEVKNEGGKITVEADEQLSSVLKDLNEPKTRAYLDFFKLVNCEGYINGALDADSLISNAQRRCRMEVTSQAGVSKTLDIYWMDLNKRSKNIRQSVTDERNRPTDIDRMYAVDLNARDTMIIQNNTFDVLLRRNYEFYTKDEEDAEAAQRRQAVPAPMAPRRYPSRAAAGAH